MNQCLTDLIDRAEHINLPAFMINHIMRIVTTPRAHDLGYGFLLTRVFENFGVELKKRVDAQVIDEVSSSTIMGCGFALIKVGDRRADQGVQTPSVPAPSRQIKVSQHLPCLFLVPLNTNQLLQRLFLLRSGFRTRSLPFSMLSRRKKS